MTDYSHLKEELQNISSAGAMKKFLESPGVPTAKPEFLLFWAEVSRFFQTGMTAKVVQGGPEARKTLFENEAFNKEERQKLFSHLLRIIPGFQDGEQIRSAVQLLRVLKEEAGVEETSKDKKRVRNILIGKANPQLPSTSRAYLWAVSDLFSFSEKDLRDIMKRGGYMNGDALKALASHPSASPTLWAEILSVHKRGARHDSSLAEMAIINSPRAREHPMFREVMLRRAAKHVWVAREFLDELNKTELNRIVDALREDEQGERPLFVHYETLSVEKFAWLSEKNVAWLLSSKDRELRQIVLRGVGEVKKARARRA